MRALLVLLVVARTAHASPTGGAWLQYELTDVAQIEDRDHRAPVRDLLLAGARLHGFVGGDVLAYHVGLDLAAGATIAPGGFAYDVALFPFGFAVRPRERAVIAFGAGIGATGAVPTLDGAVTLPLELNAQVGGGRVRGLARVRTAWLSGAPGRAGGAPSAPFGDELEAMLGMRIGHAYDEWDIRSGNGYFLAASYRELEGARYLGVTLGYSIDLAKPWIDHSRVDHVSTITPSRTENVR